MQLHIQLQLCSRPASLVTDGADFDEGVVLGAGGGEVTVEMVLE